MVSLVIKNVLLLLEGCFLLLRLCHNSDFGILGDDFL